MVFIDFTVPKKIRKARVKGLVFYDVLNRILKSDTYKSWSATSTNRRSQQERDLRSWFYLCHVKIIYVRSLI